MTNFKILDSPKAPRVIGPYSQGLLPTQPGLPVYLSGQIGIDPQTNQLVSKNVKDQTKQAIQNIKAVLSQEGLTFNDVIFTQILLTDLNDYSPVNQIYAQKFTDHQPARATFVVKALPLNAKIEIIITAWKIL